MRDGKLDPAPVAGTPMVVSLGTMAGLMDIALHPRFAQNKWIFISYHKPMGTAKSVDGRDAPIASNAILRGTWDGKALTEVRDIFVADDVDMEASRICFGQDGMLYMGIGGPGTGSKISMDRAQGTNDLAGKVLRMKDDGTVPPDNPFVGRTGYKPYIYSLGHRVPLGLAMNPYNGEIWETENGPNGGDELNVIRAGRNYGWPIVSYGRDYNGPRFSPTLAGMEDPLCLLGAVDCDVGSDVLHRRQVSRLDAQRVRGRHARRGDPTHRTAPAHRVQRQVGRDAPRAAAAGAAPAHSRRPSGSGRTAVPADGRGPGRVAADRAHYRGGRRALADLTHCYAEEDG